MHQIDSLAAPVSAKDRFALIELLVDAVDGGAAVGFVAPLTEGEAGAFWDKAVADIAHRTILVARDEAGRILGSVQMMPSFWPSQLHRADIAKLLVHSAHRRKGLGRALMLAAEEAARALGRSLITLDARRGDVAIDLYGSLGYTEVGIIPRYGRNSQGVLEDCALFYKELS
ncbi:N-acetyltransferase family protein [Dongia sp.]|uniref:GNAT family N-acetyltransferase n=1 Tax=Dongia sp. TaxID=1977262 RepID=UPI0035AF89AC